MRYFRGHYVMLLVTAVMLGSCSNSDDDVELVGNWMKRAAFGGVTRTEAVSFVINDSAYVGTGYQTDDNIRLNDFWSYDPRTDQWTQLASLPGDGRNSAVGMAINGKGYIGTGYNGTIRLNDFYEYDPVAGTWDRKQDVPGIGREGAVAFSLGQYGYIATGYNGGYLNDCLRYNPGSDSWDPAASVKNDKRKDASVFVINNQAFIVGGYNSVGDVTELAMFDGTTWTLKRPISNISDEDYDDEYNLTTRNAVAFVMNNRAYLCTGDRSGGSISGMVWEYDAVNDLWDQKHDFDGLTRTGAVGFAINNRGFLLTGSNGRGLDDVWEYDPWAEYDEND